MFYDWAAGRYDRNAWSALTRVNERCVGHGSGHASDLAIWRSGQLPQCRRSDRALAGVIEAPLGLAVGSLMRWWRDAPRAEYGQRRFGSAVHLSFALAPACRRHSKFSPESPTECRLRFITNLLRYSGEGLSAGQQFLRRDLHAPSRQVLHWRLSKKIGKALCQRGAR